jgi:CRP-like cAMP-binding protein
MVSDEEFRKEILEKLDVLTKLVAVTANAQTLLGGRSQKDQVKVLADLGLSRNIIALVVRTTPETVSVRLSEMKSKQKAEKKPLISSEEGSEER